MAEFEEFTHKPDHPNDKSDTGSPTTSHYTQNTIAKGKLQIDIPELPYDRKHPNH